MSAFRFLILSLVIGVATACGGAQRGAPQWEDGIYNIRSGEKITTDELRTVLENAQVIIVGESHDSVEDHARQVDVITMVPDGALVGMEMFQRPFQEALDAFSAGEIDEAEMLRRTEWENRWGFDPALYRPIWERARQRGFSLIALNLARELTKRISAVGLAQMTEQERDALPMYDLSDEKYKTWLRDVFSSHGAIMEDAQFERFFEAQVMWDETMAEAAVFALRERAAQRIVMIVGRGHVERDWGIPARVRRRTDFDFPDIVTIVPSRGELPSIETLRSQKFADFVWVTREKPTQ